MYTCCCALGWVKFFYSKSVKKRHTGTLANENHHKYGKVYFLGDKSYKVHFVIMLLKYNFFVPMKTYLEQKINNILSELPIFLSEKFL